MADVQTIGERFRAATGNPAALTELLHPEIVWVLPGDNAVSGEARGIDAVLARFGTLAGYHVQIQIEHVTVGRDGGAFIVHNTGEHNGRLLDEHLVSAFTVREGKIARIDTYVSDLPMMDAYFTD